MADLNLKFITDVNDNEYEVVEFHGEMDKSTLAVAEKQLLDLAGKFNRQYLIFDLTALSYINSEGIGLFISINTQLSEKGKKLFICGIGKEVSEVFEQIGILKIIPAFAHIADAISFIKKK